MTVWIKTSLNSVTVSTTTDGVVQSTLSVLGTNKWKQYEIPFVVGGTDQGLIVEAGEAGDVFIDEPFVGLAPAGYVSKIATTITDWEDFTPTGSWSTNTTYTGKYRRVGDVAEISVRMLTSGTPDNTTLQINLPDGLVIDTSKLAGTTTFTSPIDGVATIKDASADSYLIKPVYGSTTAINFVTHYDNASGLNNIVHLGVINNTRPMTWANGDYLDVIFQVPIVGWSTDYSTVVTQNTELTAQTANEFSAKIFSDGTVTSENYNFINDNCTTSTISINDKNLTKYSCSFVNNIFSVEPVCIVSNDVGDLLRGNTPSISTSGIDIITYALISTYPPNSTNTPINIHCSKQGTDVNKSATIIGKFNAANMADDMQTKCQTKYLSSSVTTSGTSDNTDPSYIPALDSIEFNNLTIGKKYEVKAFLRSLNTASGDNIILRLTNNGNIVASPVTGAGVNLSPSAFDSGIFTAQSTTLFASVLSINAGNAIQGIPNNRESTHVTLCELPDTFVETDEW